MQLTNQQLLFVLYSILFFYFNSLLLNQILGNLMWAYLLSFVGTNLMMFNILYATQEGAKYLELMQVYITDLVELVQSDPEETSAEYFWRLGEIAWKWVQRFCSFIFAYFLPVVVTPMYFTMISGYRILGYVLIGPLRIMISLVRWFERLLNLE